MKPLLPAEDGRASKAVVTFAWVVTAVLSFLPDILFKEWGGGLPGWLWGLKVGLVGACFLASLLWRPLRALRLYFAVVLAVFLLDGGVDWIYRQLSYTTWLAGMEPFLQAMFSVQIPRLTKAGLLVLVMLALTGSFARFFFVKGKLDAPAAPIPLILTRPPSWRVLGPAIAAAMCLGLLVFIYIFGRPYAPQEVFAVLPLLPWILLFAASNAFGEEMLYRAPWLAALAGPLGKAQALLLTALFFGVGHFYGVPYGVTGVVMAFIPGWLMGKAMLETRGFLWAWFIHLCMDTVIFFFIALGAVTPGG